MAVVKSGKLWFLLGAVGTLGLIVATSTCIGVLVGTRIANSQSDQLRLPLPLHAGTAAKGKTLSMATGLIDGDVEGLYLLDHASGNLQCWILNARTGAVGGIYRTNVLQALASTKVGEADYVMTTGNFFWNGGKTGNLTPSQSVVYIADEATGNVVGYHLTFNEQGIQRGEVQTGLLNLVCQGATRGESVKRDQ